MTNLRTFSRMIAGKPCMCIEAHRLGMMRLRLEASFGDGYDVTDLMLIPTNFPDNGISILSDFWLTEKEKELGLPVGCSCNSNNWFAGFADESFDYLHTDRYSHLLPKVLTFLSKPENGGIRKVNIYFDKNGNQILAGMTIRHNDGDTEKVYATQDTDGSEDLGIDAVSKAWRAKHPDCEDEFYPLSSICLREWEIMNEIN